MEKVTLFFCDIYGTFIMVNKFKVDDFQNFLEELKINHLILIMILNQ